MMRLSAVREVRVGPVRMGNRQRMVLLAGAHPACTDPEALAVAQALKDLATSMRIQYIYRARLSTQEPHDIGRIADGVSHIREQAEVPIVADVSQVEEIGALANWVEGFIVSLDDPEFDSLVAATKEVGMPVGIRRYGAVSLDRTGRAVDAIGDRAFIVEDGGGVAGSTVELADLPALRGLGAPLVLDATACWAGRGSEPFESVHLARAGAAVGIDGLAFSVWEGQADMAPDHLATSQLQDYLVCMLAIDRVVRAGTRYV